MHHYVNGRIRHERHLFVSPLEHGFLYGAGLFETFRTYSGVPFLLDDHFARLEAGAEELEIVLPEDWRHSIRRAIPKLLRRNRLADAYIRLNVSARGEGIGLPAAPYTDPLQLMLMKKLPEAMPASRPLVTLQTRRNRPEGSVRRKSHHYGNNIIGKRETNTYDAQAEGLFLDDRGAVSEGVTSNVFFVHGSTLKTPDASCGCLPGVTAVFVQALAEEAGWTVRTGRFSPGEAAEADEVFLTNSIQEIVPVSSWDGSPLPGAAGTVTGSLQQLYQRARHSFKENR
ncbi:aminotransferase class IV [Alkalicoccus chagannorensis]|uniref:aminotransferase class IV n=1 Tax=Alkalicoccus chagannorensis TaxID=427072 RepID=UPI0003FD89DD|nr:aminotransferase class IV [Alkalicoccus chagannorensis]